MDRLSTKNILLAATTLGLCSAGLSSAATYALDDGVVANGISIGTGNEGVIVNAFQSVPDAEKIGSISFAFTDSTPVSTAFDIILFSDPNNDANPGDALEIGRLTVMTPEAITAGTFVSYDFLTPITVAAGDWFFAGLVEGAGYSINLGTDAAGGTSTWAAFPGDGFASASSSGTLASFGIPRDAMIRVEAVPEISTHGLLGIGLLGCVLRRSRR